MLLFSKEQTKAAQKFCYENFAIVVKVALITAAGGVLGLVFSPWFAVIFPVWLIYAAWVLKGGYRP